MAVHSITLTDREEELAKWFAMKGGAFADVDAWLTAIVQQQLSNIDTELMNKNKDLIAALKVLDTTNQTKALNAIADAQEKAFLTNEIGR